MAETFSDLDPLIAGSHRRTCCRTRVLCPLLVCIGLVALLTAILIGYFSNTYEDGFALRVMALNTWGMPAAFGAKDKELRMQAIGNMIAKKEYDVYLLEELWMEPDHTAIKNLLPEGYDMTTYGSLTQGRCAWLPLPLPFLCCDGDATPSGCSGLAVVSRFPMQDVEFTMYDDHGPMADFEKLARKGIGRVRIEPKTNLTIDLFVTHTCASDSDEDKAARHKQVDQLVKIIKTSTAEFTILGGDFNSDPRKENLYEVIKKDMQSSMEDFFKLVTDWLVPKRASYGNPRNTYSNTSEPVLYDYIWHRSGEGNLVITNLFDLPFLTTIKQTTLTSEEQEEISANKPEEKSTNKSGEMRGMTRRKRSSTVSMSVSLSDHEAVGASLLLFPKRKKMT